MLWGILSSASWGAIQLIVPLHPLRQGRWAEVPDCVYNADGEKMIEPNGTAFPLALASTSTCLFSLDS